MKYSKKNIVECFSKIIENYLFNATCFLSRNKNILNVDYIIKKGINVIVHIFKLLMIQTKNLKLVFNSTSHAYTLYLEYIEQINKPPVMTDLNMVDAITFVIDKTLLDISNEIELVIVDLDISIVDILDKLLNKCGIFFEGIVDTETDLKNTIENYYQSVKRGDLISTM